MECKPRPGRALDIVATSPTLRRSTTICPPPLIRPIQCPEQCGVKIVNGVILFWLLGEWKSLSNELWAWKLVTAWAAGERYSKCNIWVPSLLLFDFWEHEYHQGGLSNFEVSTSANKHQLVPSATSIIAPRLFKILSDFSASDLCRTCRLVCRDWARECPAREPKDCNWKVEDGVVWHWIETTWRVLPTRLWVWTLGPFSDKWWVEQGCHLQWFPKLVQPIDDAVPRNPTYPSLLLVTLSGTSRRSHLRTAAALPPELFKYICNAADNESWSSRLVCQYWNRLCTPRVFESIDVKELPERIRAFWKRRTDPFGVLQHLKVVENIPKYNKDSKFPWLHLLSHACASTRSVWNSWDTNTNRLGHITISGPFAGGHPTIRSVHFALPRSLPRSLSRGIKSLHLRNIRFRQFEDLTHLACELSDLEELCCLGVAFDSLPIELPRRRPRTNCNNLRQVYTSNSTYAIPPLPALTLYLSVYNATSFFSEGEIAVILALLQISHRMLHEFWVCYEGNPHDHARKLDIKRHFGGYGLDSTVFGLQVLQDPGQSHATFGVIFDCREATLDEDSDRWARVDTEFSKISARLRQVECVFGFADHEEMVRFETAILKTKMPSISQLASIRYSIHADNYEDGIWHPGWWYRASLDAEELTGIGETDLAKVYS